MHRRSFLANATALAAAGVASRPGVALPQIPPAQRLPFIKPRRLKVGDSVALVAPASATFNTMELDVAKESLEALGLKVQIGGHLLDRHGYLAGQDRERADDINRVFA